MADRITITDSTFSEISGAVLKLDAETDDLGIYSADYVTITGSSFSNIQGPLWRSIGVEQMRAPLALIFR